MARIDNLNNAKKNIDDEYYTRMEEIEKVAPRFREELEGKKVLLPCDHPKRSMFYKYFYDNFKKYKLKKLTTVTYEGFRYDYDGEIETINMVDGDIRHDEIDEIIEEADFIITNPPFSLFSTFFNKIKNKPFLIVAPLTSLRRSVVFDLIKDDKCFVHDKIRKFKNPSGFVILSPCIWLTNLTGKKCEDVKNIIVANKLDNYDYYNFNKTLHAFIDHSYKYKVVPTTYLIKHEPERFEIIKLIYDAKLNSKNLYTRVLIKDKEVE